MEAPPPRRPKRGTRAGLLAATRRVAKLYLRGLLLSLLSALVGLLAFFFGEWLPRPGRDPQQPERGRLVDGPFQAPAGEAERETHEPPSTCS